MPSCSLENFWKLFLVLIGLGIIEYVFMTSDLKENLLIRFSYANNGTKNEIETNFVNFTTAQVSKTNCKIESLKLKGPLNLTHILQVFDLNFLVEFHAMNDFDMIMSAYRTTFKSYYLNETQYDPKKKLTPYDDYFWSLWNTQNVSLLNTSIAEFDFSSNGTSPLQMGGSWMPNDCISQYKIAIIIPFRDRLPHLKVLTRFLHMFLQRQRADYRIFVVEPLRNLTFNKGLKIKNIF
jgi:hypothetical protein